MSGITNSQSSYHPVTTPNPAICRIQAKLWPAQVICIFLAPTHKNESCITKDIIIPLIILLG